MPKDELQPYIPDLVKNAMLTAWNEICSDTGCHPTDIKRDFEGKRGNLGFEPEHWAQMAGDMVAAQIKSFNDKTRKERVKQIGRFVMTGETQDSK